MRLNVVCTLINYEYASANFSQVLFRIVSACLANLQKFLKESLTRIVQVAHLDSTVQVRVFNRQQILTKIFFDLCFDLYGKKQIECGWLNGCAS